MYHLTSRGDRREDIFTDDEDRLLWLGIFANVCEIFHWRCHAWCQMDNHYHVVVETAEGNLSRGMRHLNGVYTQTFNRRHQRVGHVFQGRYKAILVERDAYLLELARYVVLNPVRAGMVSDAAQWRWSSYPSMLGTAAVPTWLETDWLLGQFGKERRAARQAYCDFVRAGVGLPGLWESLQGQIYLGRDDFVRQLTAGAGEALAVREIPRLQRQPLALSLSEYRIRYPDRDAAIAAAGASGDYTQQQIADFFAVHYSTVSRVLKRVRAMTECKT